MNRNIFGGKQMRQNERDIQFNVDAYTAKLIGRENVSKLEGAVLEIVKNAYDADAKVFCLYYSESQQCIYILDNGTGMKENVLRDHWMTEKYFYKDIKGRKNLTKEFGGVKLYRDHFRVRPYGEYGDSDFDWLELASRLRRSPAGLGNQKSNWRVASEQMIGTVDISRKSTNLDDAANRNGIQEGIGFEQLKREFQGRYYGGGVGELVPTEFKELPIPYHKIEKEDVETLNGMFKEKKKISGTEIDV